jgi:hypothetical protein
MAPRERECPQCLSKIPAEARRCKWCTARLHDAPEPEDPLDAHLAEPDVIGWTGHGTAMPIVN